MGRDQKLLGSVASLAIITALSGPVAAADLRAPVKAQPVAPAYYAPSWAGAYIGGHLGYGQSRSDQQTTANFGDIQDVRFGWDGEKKLQGLAVGLHAGYNWQINQFVFGLEGDGTITPWQKGYSTTTKVFLTRRMDSLASVRGRLGLAFDRTLIYATGGVAFMQAHTLYDPSHVAALDFNKTGYVVGGGIEYKYTPNVSLRLEGLHYVFNHTLQAPGSLTSNILEAPSLIEKFKSATVVRVGANFHFGQGSY